MRDGGVLDNDGIERLVYQPDERPTAPMALPDAMPVDEWKKGGGYLPSIASATAGPMTCSIATNSLSLAHWWQAFCSGKLISQESLTTMATFVDEYGLGLFDIADPYAASFGHAGEDVGYVAWAACLPDRGSVVVALSNRVMEDKSGMARPLVVAAESDATKRTAP
jgi:CubicO group peptidase (beta-lactamase class C family)